MHLGEQNDGFFLCKLVLLGIWILTGKRYAPLLLLSLLLALLCS